MLLSIIVPVYNVEKYLERCIDSLVAQDIDINDYEIIMVNDGSTDNSKAIAEQLVNKYPHVILYDQDNQGLSGARNTGMEHARGKYLMFVDSDDYLERNSLKNLINICNQNDLDVCHFRLKCLPGNHIGGIGKLQFNKLYSYREIINDGNLIGSACSNVYKTYFLRRNHLFFHEGITHEDVEFSYRLYCHAQRVMIVEDIIYYYVENSASLSKNKSFEKENKYVCDAAIIGRLSKEYVNNNNINPFIKDLVIRRVNTSVAGNLYSLLRTPCRPIEIVENLMKSYRENNLYPIKGKFLNWKFKLLSYALNNEKIYLLLYKYQRRKYEA